MALLLPQPQPQKRIFKKRVIVEGNEDYLLYSLLKAHNLA
jgi:hypothetical protein